MLTHSVPTDHDRAVDAMVRVGRAMGDATRVRILLALVEAPRHPSDLADALALTRPNVSNHLACLRGCGLVVAEPEGRRTRYALADRHLATAIRALTDTVLAVDAGTTCDDPDCLQRGCCA
jgi:DNA-binding transcriptional ArsR family regulator